MIYVLKTQNLDVITFDSILSFSESYSGGVTSQPIEDGGKISDHIITDNLKIKIQGVVTDYNFWNPLKDAANVAVPGYDYNRTGAMGLTDSNGSPALSDAPVPSDYAGKDNDTNTSVKASMDTVRQRLISIQRNKEVITILGYLVREKDSLIVSYENCVITDLSFDTSPDSGYAIYPNISIEQVNIVKVKTQFANSQKIVEEKVADQATGEDGKGNKKPGGGKDNKTAEEKKREDAYSGLKSKLDDEVAKVRCYNLWNDMQSKGQNSPPMCAIQFGLVDKTSTRSIIFNPAGL
jgi:hypothetical protein